MSKQSHKRSVKKSFRSIGRAFNSVLHIGTTTLEVSTEVLADVADGGADAVRAVPGVVSDLGSAGKRAVIGAALHGEKTPEEVNIISDNINLRDGVTYLKENAAAMVQAGLDWADDDDDEENTIVITKQQAKSMKLKDLRAMAQ